MSPWLLIAILGDVLLCSTCVLKYKEFDSSLSHKTSNKD